MDIINIISTCLEKMELERKQNIIESSLPVYNAVCMECGNVIAVKHGDKLYEKCESRKFLDALPFYGGCNVCETRKDN